MRSAAIGKRVAGIDSLRWLCAPCIGTIAAVTLAPTTGAAFVSSKNHTIQIGRHWPSPPSRIMPPLEPAKPRYLCVSFFCFGFNTPGVIPLTKLLTAWIPV